MNVTEQIEIMKSEARLANRAKGEGIRNWTPEARAASLAKRRAAGSVWGWNKRQRAVTSPAFDASIDAMTADAEEIRRAIASQKAGVPVLSAPSAGSAEVAAQRLEEFKAWLAEVQRTQTAIDDFNGIVAAAGGMMGVVGAKRGQGIGEVSGDAVGKSMLRKDQKNEKVLDAEYRAAVKYDLEARKSGEVIPYRTALEKSIRRQFEKNGGGYLRKNPEDRGTMMDMVAEKAKYYASSPAERIKMEKDAYRQIRDYGSTTMREAPASSGGDYAKLLEAKRSYVRERDAIRPQLQADEVAYPAGKGIWIGRLPNGDERVISAKPESGWLYNRAHSSKCAASQSTAGECSCSCGGSQHGTGPKVTAVTDDGKRKSAGGTRTDGTAFFASVGEDIGDGTTVVSVDVAGEKIRVRDKDGKEYDLAMNEQGQTGEKDPAAAGYENNANLTEEEKERNKITLAFGEEMKDAIDNNEGVQDAMDVYDNEGAIGMSQEERLTVLEAMVNNGKLSPELQRLQAELEAAGDVFKQVKGELIDLAKTQPVTLQDCLDQLKIDGDKDLYKIKVDALGEIYDQVTRDAFGDRATDSVTQEEWTAMQEKLGIPKEMQSDHNPDSGIENRWSDAARAAALIARRAKASARKSATGVAGPTGEAGIKGESGTGKSMADYKKLGLAGMDSDWAGNAVRRIEERQAWGKKVTADEARLIKEYNAQVEKENKGIPEPKRPYSLAANLKAAAAAREQTETEKATAEGTGDFDKTVAGFKKLISQGSFISSKNLQSQLLKDHDQVKFKMAKEALAEAWHTASLDRFQDKFGRDPNNNAEFRKFQKSIEVPVEYIGAGETK